MPPPEGTKFSFKEVMNRRETLIRALDVPAWKDQPLALENFNTLVNVVYVAMKFDPEVLPVLTEQLQSYYGKTYNDQMLDDISWRVSSSYRWLVKGYTTRDKFYVHKEHWVPLLLSDCHYTSPGKNGAVRVRVYFRVLGGPFSGLAFTQDWPHWYHVREVAKEMGFLKYSSVHYRETANMWLGGLLRVEDVRFPAVVEVYGASGAVAHNRRLRAMRDKPCVAGFNHQCHQCQIGYSEVRFNDGCSRATHSRNLIKKMCTYCSKESWFDPLTPNASRCLGCVAREVKGRLMIGGR